MRPFLHLPLAACLGLTLIAESFAAPPREVSALKENYQTAIAKAAEPITEVYKKELMKLLEKYKSANDLAGMAAVAEELVHLGMAVEMPASSKDSETDRYFVNRSWVSAAQAEYHFNKDGSGLRTHGGAKAPFTWRKLEGGIVEASGRMAPGSAPRLWFFKFESRNAAKFGGSKDAITDPLTPER